MQTRARDRSGPTALARNRPDLGQAAIRHGQWEAKSLERLHFEFRSRWSAVQHIAGTNSCMRAQMSLVPGTCQESRSPESGARKWKTRDTASHVATRPEKPREVGAHPFSTDATLVCPRNSFDQGCGWCGQFQHARCAPDSSLQLVLHLVCQVGSRFDSMGISPRSPECRGPFAQLNEVQGHQVSLEVTRSRALSPSVLNSLEHLQGQLPWHATSLCHGLGRTERIVKEGLS